MDKLDWYITRRIDEDIDGEGWVSPVGMMVAEVQTQADAIGNDLTFDMPIYSIEIYHADAVLQSFIVNGITLVVGAGGWRSPVAGTPSAVVTIPAGLTCVVARLV